MRNIIFFIAVILIPPFVLYVICGLVGSFAYFDLSVWNVLTWKESARLALGISSVLFSALSVVYGLVWTDDAGGFK